MAFVVFLKGVNVGGYRLFRPSVIAQELKDTGVQNVGAAGTFVLRNAFSRPKVLKEIARRLPFTAEIMVCSGKEILRLIDSDPFADHAARRDLVRFVSVMARSIKPLKPLPLDLPSRGRWSVRILACQGRFVAGLHRREMKAIGHLGKLEKIVGVPMTTRSWNTFLTIGKLLRQ